jgi:hypothetical protein
VAEPEIEALIAEGLRLGPPGDRLAVALALAWEALAPFLAHDPSYADIRRAREIARRLAGDREP